MGGRTAGSVVSIHCLTHIPLLATCRVPLDWVCEDTARLCTSSSAPPTVTRTQWVLRKVGMEPKKEVGACGPLQSQRGCPGPQSGTWWEVG